MFLRAAAFRANAFAARFLGGEVGGVIPPDPPVDPPEPPISAFTGGVGAGYGRREFTERERKELLKRVRKSLGLDKNPEPPRPVVEIPSMAGPVSRAAIVVRQAAALADEDDDEMVVLLSAVALR